MAVLLKICTLLALVAMAVSLDEKQFREIKHKDVDPDLDLKWMGSVKTWYVPLWSKLYRAQTVADVFEKKISQLTQKEWNMQACGMFDGSNMYSALGKKTPFNCKPTMDDGVMEGFVCKAPWSGAVNVNLKFKLTDNKDFILGVNEAENGEGSWVVLSTSPTLKKEDKQRIVHMVQALGFNEDLMVKEDYVGCNLDKIEL